MVDFEQTAGGGLRVVVDTKPIGWINKERGFFTDPSIVRELTEVSSRDLRQIAEKADEVKSFGVEPEPEESRK